MKCQHNVSRIYTDLCDWVDDNGADSILASETMMEVSNLLIQTWAVYSWRLMVGDIERTEAEDFTIGHRNSDPKLEIERIYDEYMMVTEDRKSVV